MKAPLLIVSHAAALALGLLLFRSFAPSSPVAPDDIAAGKSQIRETATPSLSAPVPARPGIRSEQRPKASVHLVAWKTLADEGLTRPERMKASALLLQSWIKEDWRAALDVVMKETPDDFALLDEFHEAFEREAETVWQMIEEKRYGVLSSTLRGHWQSALRRRDEASIRQLAATLPERGRQAALETLGMERSR